MWCQWRYRGIDPDIAWTGVASPWRSRIDAVLFAFALRAGEVDSAARDLLDGFAKQND